MLLPVLLPLFKVILHVSEFAIRKGYFKWENISLTARLSKFVVLKLKKVTLRYGKNANTARILVEAEQINFKVLVKCIFIQTTEKGSFEVNNIMKSVKGRMKE